MKNRSCQIFYYCPQNLHPTGGNKIAYRHVTLLQQAGFNAYIYHPTDDFCYSGFADNPPIVGPSSIKLCSSDIFVLPEDSGPGLQSFAKGLRKIIFNQNAYYTFRHFDYDSNIIPPYGQGDFIGTFVVSEDNKNYLEYAFPSLSVHRLILSLDYDTFQYTPWHQKRRQICFMTRKNYDDVVQVLKILSIRLCLEDWKFIPMQGLPESEVARIMKESMIFLSFGHPEGLSLSNLEALACGCKVIGYSGRAGKEYFSHTDSDEITFGDIIGFCQAVELFVRSSCLNQSKIARVTYNASEYIKNFYSLKREKETLLAAYSNLISQRF